MKRRIEITLSRRRTTIHLREKREVATVEPQLHQAEALQAVVVNLPPAEKQLPPVSLAPGKLGSENHVSEVEPEAE